VQSEGSVLRHVASCLLILLAFGPFSWAQTAASSVSYSTPDRGGMVLATPGGTNPIVIGYARLQPAATTTPTASAIFSFRQNGVTVTEAGIPGMTAILSGRTYAEVSGSSINTGLAFANPSSAPVNISFNFTDQNGNDFGQGVFTLGANTQLVRFLSDSPFRAASFVGTFTFTGSAPVGVIAVRTRINERGEFLVTTQTVTPLPTSISTSPLVLAQFAIGGGWTTQVLLVNTGDAAITGTVQFLSEGSAAVAGAPITLSVNGQIASSFAYSIRPHSSAKLETTGDVRAATQAGSVLITPDAGLNAPSASEIFLFSNNSVTVSMTSILTPPAGTAFRTYVEANSNAAIPGAIQSGIAIANNTSTAATVNFELTSLGGFSAGVNASVVVPATGHVSKFLTELFPSLSLPFRGILRVSSSNQIVLVSVRAHFNERGDVLAASVPSSNEASPSTTGELIFPEIVDQGGYATQFILFSGISGQSTMGTINFFASDGTALNLIVH
jgi:hypothetical protein